MMSAFYRFTTAAAFVGLIAFTVQEVDARGGFSRGGGGGGVRSGGASSISRGGSGGFGGSGFSRGGSYSRPGGGSYSRPSQLPAGAAGRPGGVGGAGGAGGAGRPGGVGGVGDAGRPGGVGGVGGAGGVGGVGRPSQLPAGGRNNVGTGNRVNNGSINLNIDNHWGGGWGGWYDHPIAAGVAIGTVAGLTAAAYGTAYYGLPSGCSPYPYYSYTYYSCGSAWYQPQYEGDTVVYVTVPDPKQQGAPPKQ